MGAEGIIHIKRTAISEPEENHNTEEAYSVPRETKDSHIDTISFQNDQEGNSYFFKKHPGR